MRRHVLAVSSMAGPAWWTATLAWLTASLVCLTSPAQALTPATTADADGAAATRQLWLPILQREAALRGLPPALADAVAMVETGYRADAVGSSGEIGMMQVMPATARQLGFTGTLEQLFQPETNIRLGVEYLARAWALAGGNVCRALTKYRAGLGEDLASPLSITYCARAMTWLDATGSELAQGGAQLGGGVAADAPPAPDPHVVSMFPPLPEQAGLLAATRLPAIITPAAYFAAPVQPAASPRSMAGRAHATHPRRRVPVDKAAAAVEAALSDN